MIDSNFTERLSDKLSFDMIYVEGGQFSMGSDRTGKGDTFREDPIHNVYLNSFLIGKHLVTQALWTFVMSEWDDFAFHGTQRPAENISWNDAQIFLGKLRLQTDNTYRLLTEAEWEFAARGGNQSKGFIYSGGNKLNEVGWFWQNRDKETKHVGQLFPNELGIYDMSGNVYEWCEDWYSDDYYEECARAGLIDNPVGPDSGDSRVCRGGYWNSSEDSCRSCYRSGSRPGNRINSLGFRLAISSNQLVG